MKKTTILTKIKWRTTEQTKTHSNHPKNAPIGSPEVKVFLHEVEQTLIDKVNKEKNLLQKERDTLIVQLLEDLQTLDHVVISSDKTNVFETISINKYKK